MGGCIYCNQYTYNGRVYTLQAVTVDPRKVLGATILSSLLGAIIGSAIYGQFPPKDEESWARFIASFVSSGFAGLTLTLLAASMGV